MSLRVHPLTPERWADLEAVFNARGCSVARGCWCMYYRRSGKPPPPSPGESPSMRNRTALMALAQRDPPPGLIGYEGAEAVGWVSLGPREDYAKLERSPLMRRFDAQPVWAIVCFVVPSPYRGRGVARALLDGAIDYAAGRGVELLEAYPVDTDQTPGAESLWFGTRSMYERAGFVEVARRTPGRPVMRLDLTSHRVRRR